LPASLQRGLSGSLRAAWARAGRWARTCLDRAEGPAACLMAHSPCNHKTPTTKFGTWPPASRARHRQMQGGRMLPRGCCRQHAPRQLRRHGESPEGESSAVSHTTVARNAHARWSWWAGRHTPSCGQCRTLTSARARTATSFDDHDEHVENASDEEGQIAVEEELREEGLRVIGVALQSASCRGTETGGSQYTGRCE
jgi:hypothetical protein